MLITIAFFHSHLLVNYQGDDLVLHGVLVLKGLAEEEVGPYTRGDHVAVEVEKVGAEIEGGKTRGGGADE